MGGQLLLLSLLAAVTAAVSGQQQTSQASSISSSSFQGQGAALSESVGPDGTRQGECAYADSTGQQIQVRIRQQQGREAEYLLIKGDPNTDPAASYEQCLAQHKASQQAGASFIPDIHAFNPFADGAFDFGSFANAAQGFGGNFGGGHGGFHAGAVNPALQAAADVRHHHDQVGAAAQVDALSGVLGHSFLLEQMEALRRQNLQLQRNVFEMQRQNAELHNRLAGRFRRGAL